MVESTPEDRLITVGEAAKLYGTTPATLRRVLIAEEVPVEHFGTRNIRIKESDVLRLKAARFRPLAK